MWRKIKISKTPVPRVEYATIGDGRLTLGIMACRLIDLKGKEYAEFLRDSDNPNYIGITFGTEKTEDSLPIVWNYSQAPEKTGRTENSITFTNKDAMFEIFGEIGIAPRSVKCPIVPDPDSHDMLIIDLSTQKPAKSVYKRNVESAVEGQESFDFEHSNSDSAHPASSETEDKDCVEDETEEESKCDKGIYFDKKDLSYVLPDNILFDEDADISIEEIMEKLRHDPNSDGYSVPDYIKS